MHMIDDAAIAKAREEYERDGATVMRQVLSPEQVEVLGRAVDHIMQPGSAEPDFVNGENLSNEGGRFFNSNFAYRRNADLQDLVFRSDLGRIAGEMMQSSQVRFFYDQILVKEPGTADRTPWHQDLPYYPIDGEHVISFWVALDRATPENGVVTYVKGSHRWNRFFSMQAFSDKYRESSERERSLPVYDDAEARGQPRNLADIRDHPENYEFLSWSVEPGDILVHHPLTIHGSSGNSSTGMRRRAIATRWLGDDARWNDTRPNFMRALKGRKGFEMPPLELGDKLDVPLFPLVWSREGASA